MSQPLGRRERNRVERRQRLEDVALQLFERDGYEATTIERIADAAGLAPRTFFSYFASKDDVLLADYASRLERILGELDKRPPEESAWDALGAAFAEVARDYQREADRIHRRLAIMTVTPSVMARSLQLQVGWEVAVAQALRARLGVAVDDPGPGLFAAGALAVMRASVAHWLLTKDAPALPELVQAGFARLGGGLAR